MTKRPVTKSKLEETREFIQMLRSCGVMEYIGEGIQVKLLPKTLDRTLDDDIPELANTGLMGETVEKLSRSKDDYDKDLFWSR